MANSLVFLAVNVVGLFVHNLMEHAQRRAFLDTRYVILIHSRPKWECKNRLKLDYILLHHFRNCIAARLEMEDENEKLVSELRM